MRTSLIGLLAVWMSLLPSVARADPDTVQVFLSHNPESFNDPNALFPQARTVPGGPDILAQALTALVQGPTPAEAAGGFYSDIHNMLNGASTCKGQDVVVMVTMGIATVQICHPTQSAGIGQDARAQREIEATVQQFGGITRVIVLGGDGHCLFDESGLDLCLT
jgi:hypothetical protein